MSKRDWQKQQLKKATYFAKKIVEGHSTWRNNPFSDLYNVNQKKDPLFRELKDSSFLFCKSLCEKGVSSMSNYCNINGRTFLSKYYQGLPLFDKKRTEVDLLLKLNKEIRLGQKIKSIVSSQIKTPLRRIIPLYKIKEELIKYQEKNVDILCVDISNLSQQDKDLQLIEVVQDPYLIEIVFNNQLIFIGDCTVNITTILELIISSYV